MVRSTVVGFYDTMGPDAVQYCFDQTNATSLFCSKEYLVKMLDMRNSGKAQSIRDIILFDVDSDYEQNK
jgi:long-subunit acyl-CoA synthetase (AMP-forming)